MITIDLPKNDELRLRQLAEAMGQETTVLALRAIEEFLAFHAEDSAADWAEASVALAVESLGDESWDGKVSSRSSHLT